jgi:peptidoglycan hydrolase-like protein with peptidoglycan-binding domain
MARKIIKLTETELNRIIRKVISEQSSYTGYNTDSGFNTSPGYQEKPTATEPTVQTPPTQTPGVLKIGSRGTQVMIYQQYLYSLNASFEKILGPKGADGIYGPNTAKAVQEFQGIYGTKSPKPGELDSATAQKLSQAGKPTVTKIQKMLIEKGYKIPAGATGIPSVQTKAAVSQFQKAEGLPNQNGTLDYATRTKILEAPEWNQDRRESWKDPNEGKPAAKPAVAPSTSWQAPASSGLVANSPIGQAASKMKAKKAASKAAYDEWLKNNPNAGYGGGGLFGKR